MKATFLATIFVMFAGSVAMADGGTGDMGMGMGKGKGKGKGPCAKFKCFEKAKGDRSGCRQQKRSCHQEQFKKRLSRWQSKGGVKAAKKEKVVARMKTQIEKKSAHLASMQEHIELMKAHLKEVEALPVK